MKQSPCLPASNVESVPRFRGIIREAVRGDISALVAIHRESLGGDFLVRLGPSFLKRVFFPALFDSPRSTLYLAEEDGQPLGLLVGRVGLGGVLGEALRYHPVWFFVTVVGAYIRSPWLLYETVGIVAQLWWRRSQPADDQGDMFLIAVSEAARRRGVASSLIRHVMSAFREAGIHSYRILAHAENAGSAATFESVGFRERTLSRFAGRLWRELALDQRFPAGA
jgi:ribosomal protein S18 acetylase RimI-like enzyme